MRRLVNSSFRTMHLNLLYIFSVFSFVKATVPENRVIKIVPVSTTELPSTPSVKECVSEKLQELKQQLQINNNANKLEFITIQEQNKNILKNEKIYFTKLEAKCVSGLTEFRKILNEIKNSNKNEINHLHKELEKIYQNINTKIDKTPSVKERISEKLQELKQQLQINNNKNKLEFITIQEQNKNILKNEEIYFTNLEEFRKILNEIKNSNKNEINHLHVELEKINQNINTINTKIDKIEENIVQIIQKEINANSNKLKDYLTTTCNTKLNTSELTRQINETETIIPTTKPFRDCDEIKLLGNYQSGVYNIQPKSTSNQFLAWCDMDTFGGGWMYILNRFDGSQNFDQNWNAYKFGFGTVTKEFWIGLENLYLLTSSKRTQLLVELSDWEENTVYAHYDDFQIGSEKEGYKLKRLGQYTGVAGDALRFHLGMKFSTYDKDQDIIPEENYAKTLHGGWWWYNAWLHGKLTGLYLKKHNFKEKIGIHWVGFKDYNYSLKSARMMIKPFWK